MKIQILSSAKDDLIAGYYFYENQKEDLGEYFLNALYADIDSLLINAGVHEIVYNNYYRLLSKRFPFAIYYTFDGETARVYAVLDTRRNPTWINNKLKK